MSRPRGFIDTSAGAVSFAQVGPDEGPLLVLGHGAGAGMDSDFMATMSDEISSSGVAVARFNFPYLDAGRKAPDSPVKLEAVFADVVARCAHGGRVVFAGGKSMGGRIASQAAARGMACAGLVFLGYPLHPPGRPERRRDAHLHEVAVPMLFAHGTRDPFCSVDEASALAEALGDHAELLVIDDGDHSFKVRKSSGRSTRVAWREVATGVVSWIERVAART